MMTIHLFYDSLCIAYTTIDPFGLGLHIDSIHTLDSQKILVGFQDRGNIFGEEFLHLLWCTAHKELGVHHLVQLAMNSLELIIALDAIHKVIGFTFTLDDRASFHGMHTNFFVQFLSVAASLDA